MELFLREIVVLLSTLPYFLLSRVPTWGVQICPHSVYGVRQLVLVTGWLARESLAMGSAMCGITAPLGALPSCLVGLV